ncbi:MAG: hypothetical protein WCT32_02795 [Patescibacteria group bacterium]
MIATATTSQGIRLQLLIEHREVPPIPAIDRDHVWHIVAYDVTEAGQKTEVCLSRSYRYISPAEASESIPNLIKHIESGRVWPTTNESSPNCLFRHDYRR